MVEGGSGTGYWGLWFQSLVLASGKGEMEEAKAPVADWKDLPMELLIWIISLADDRTAIAASGVCTSWRDAVSAGLTHLSLSWCKSNMNDLVLLLAPRFTNLQVLSLRQNKLQLDDRAIVAVATYCHDLRDLDLSRSLNLSDQSLHALAHGCPQLTKLNISGCSAFSDSALSYLSSFCRNLTSLNLCGCVRAASDKALRAIAYNCSQLQYLNLGWCDGVTDEGVISLALGCPDLRAVDLCGCILITDESVIALAVGCPRLRSLGLYYCRNITDRAMYCLAKSRRNSHGGAGLMHLNVSQCTALTPPAVQAVCDASPALHSLIISGCLSLTSVHCACGVHAHGSSAAAG